MYYRYYRLVRRLRGFLLLAALVLVALHFAAPGRFPLLPGLVLAGAWLAAFLYALGHVLLTRRRTYQCPYCGWVPYALDAWRCRGCGQRVDVFLQLGICPACGYQHEEFMCLRCRGVAPRQRWLRLG
jgi:hypothetical protein